MMSIYRPATCNELKLYSAEFHSHFSEVDVGFELPEYPINEDADLEVCAILSGAIQDGVLVEAEYETNDGTAVGKF